MREIYDVFRQCFPYIPMSYSVFEKKLYGCRIEKKSIHDVCVAFSAVSHNVVVLLCVHPDYQLAGLGTELLRKSEKFICEQGFDKIILGRSQNDIFFGAVMDELSHIFFKKHGYFAYNGNLCMSLKSSDFCYQDFIKKNPYPDGTEIILCSEEMSKYLYDVIKIVEPKWAENHFDFKNIIISVTNGTVNGFLVFDDDADTLITTDTNRVGLLRYVGVLTEYRRKNIGKNLIAYGIYHLSSIGCTDLFINYTALDQWYSKIGFEEFIWYWMGEKSINYIHKAIT